MRVSLRTKLFLILLLANSALFCAHFAFSRYSFQRDFFGYLSEVQLARLESLAVRLEQLFGREGNWQRVHEDVALWPHALNMAARIDSGEDDESVDERPAARRGAENERSGDENAGGEQHPRLDDQRPAFEAGPPPPRDDQRPPPMHPPEMHRQNELHFPGAPPHLPAPRPKVVLLDADKTRVIGDPIPVSDLRLRPLHVGERIVGYLGVPQRAEINAELDQAFAHQQEHSLLVYAVVLIALSSLLAYFLAAWLARRLQRLADGARILREGDYDYRLDVHGHDELAQLTRDFNALAQSLAQNKTQREHWFADISHELRTPVAILRGEIDALVDGVRPVSAAAMASLQQELQHLQRLIDDLYSLAVFDAGRMQLHISTLDFAELVDDVVAQRQPELNAKPLRVVTKIVPASTCEFDATRLKQLLSNLLENSLRYTDGGGEVHIQFEQSETQFILEWQDSAPGVPPQDIGQLFERFFRVEQSRNRARAGSGLGLSICRAIIEAHGGHVVASASNLGGLKLRFTWPRDVMQQGRVAKSDSISSGD